MPKNKGDGLGFGFVWSFVSLDDFMTWKDDSK